MIKKRKERYIQSVTSIAVDVRLFRRISRTRPVSSTYTTSGIVTLVSAMLVAQMILRQPGRDGTKAWRWSREERVECSGIRSKRCRSRKILLPSNRSERALISPSPGGSVGMRLSYAIAFVKLNHIKGTSYHNHVFDKKRTW